MPLILQDEMRLGTDIIHAPDGHSYHCNKVKNGRVYLRCYQYYKRRCRGTGCINLGDENFRRLGVHNHRKPRFLIHERRFRHAVLNRCRAGDTASFKTIYHEERRRLRIPREAAGSVSLVKLRPSMQLARARLLPNIPHSLSELGRILQNPEYAHITSTLDGEDNLFSGIVGNSNNGTRCVLLFSRRQLRYLARTKKVFSDATFSVPNDLGCYQIWNLVTLRRNHIIRLGRVLMQSKTTECYTVALRAVRTLVPLFDPNEIMCDFELMEQDAWAEVYPNATCHGCHFHHTKNVCSKAKELGLTVLLRTNDHADSIVRSLCAIPLLRREQIIDGVRTVMDRAERRGLHQLAPLFDYYTRTWILNRTRFRVMSVHGCKYCTSNCVESENRDLRAEVKDKHPGTYKLLHGAVNLEDEAQLDLETLRQGFNPSRRRRQSSLLNDATIIGLNEDLDEGNINVGTFLRRASRRIQGAYDDFIFGNAQ